MASPQCPPNGFKARRSIDIRAVAARLLHFVTPDAFVAAMPMLRFQPHVFYSPARGHVVLASIGEEHEPLPYIWVDAMPLLDAPVFQAAPGPMSLQHWDGSLTVFEFGDVVQIRSRLSDLVSLSPDGARRALAHAFVLAFPVYGPYVRFRGYTLRITPEVAYQSFTREVLYAHFRRVYTKIVPDLHDGGGSAVMLVGPGLALRLATGGDGAPPLSTVQTPYNSIWKARKATRDVVSLNWRLGGVWLYAALPRRFAGTLWVYKAAEGLTWVEGNRDGSGLHTCPLMTGTVSYLPSSLGLLEMHVIPLCRGPALQLFRGHHTSGTIPTTSPVAASWKRCSPCSAPGLRLRSGWRDDYINVWSAVASDLMLSFPTDASFSSVASIASRQEARRVVRPCSFVPVFPACGSPAEFIECRPGQHCGARACAFYQRPLARSTGLRTRTLCVGHAASDLFAMRCFLG